MLQLDIGCCQSHSSAPEIRVDVCRHLWCLNVEGRMNVPIVSAYWTEKMTESLSVCVCVCVSPLPWPRRWPLAQRPSRRPRQRSPISGVHYRAWRSSSSLNIAWWVWVTGLRSVRHIWLYAGNIIVSRLPSFIHQSNIDTITLHTIH